MSDISGYKYRDGHLNDSHRYLVPATIDILERTARSIGEKSLFDLGCGNGAVANIISQRGYRVAGVDPSAEGIIQAKNQYPNLDLRVGSGYDNLSAQFGTFSYVLSLEVIGHVYSPKIFAKTAFGLLDEGGYAIISTPYHGYLKNLALALTNQWDRHFTALWDNGIIKFWSIDTLSQLLRDVGFRSTEFVRVGRVPSLAKSMIAIARK